MRPCAVLWDPGNMCVVHTTDYHEILSLEADSTYIDDFLARLSSTIRKKVVCCCYSADF